MAHNPHPTPTNTEAAVPQAVAPAASPEFAELPGLVRKSESPLSGESFSELARVWRPFGLWLSMWNGAGSECLADDREGPRFWMLTWRSGKGFTDALQGAVRRAAADPGRLPAHPYRIAGVPGLPGACLLIVPVCRRRKLLGLCVAASVGAGAIDDETLQRFCAAGELEVQAMRRALLESPGRSATELTSFAEALALQVRQTQARIDAESEIVSLSRNLDSTYEELNLIFRINRGLSIAEEPGALLRQIGEEVLEVSRADGLTFLHSHRPPDPAPLAGASASEAERADCGYECVARIGCGGIQPDALAHLGAVLGGPTVNDEARIFNNAAAESRLAWARDWLRHAIFLPLKHKGRDLGAMVALNCKDSGDFTSVDLQLLRAVGDRVSAFLDNQRLYDNLAELFMGLLHALINSIDAKDPYTCGHSERVAFLSRRVAEAAGTSPVEAQRVYLAGLLHDVGKIGIADAILCKPGKLTPEEFDILRKHPEIGARIMQTVPQVADLLPGILYHHERMDGRGYPAGLAGPRIPRMARIICLADCLDAMTTTRTYRSFLPVSLAIAEVRRCAGTQFDPHLAEALLAQDVDALLREAHEFAGSRLPGAGDGGASEPARQSFAQRPIFTREMFATQVKSW